MAKDRRTGPILTALAIPVLLVQGLWVAARAQRLPEAKGDRSGTVGQGAPLRVLILGDSSAAGVGVAHQSDALVGRIAARLSRYHTVHWTVLAKSGATTGSVLRMLADHPPQAFDIAVVALGVNDAKNGVSQAAWRSNYASILIQLETRFGVTQTCVSGMPPLGEFPLLPNPLRRILGRRAARFDKTLRDLTGGRAGITYVPLDFEMNPSFMASDGFHPGPAVYDAWAVRVVAALDGLDRDQ